MNFDREYFPGYTRAPGQTRLYTRPRSTTRPATRPRTSGTKKVTFKDRSPSPRSLSPSPTRRTSKKRSPRSHILHNIKKGFRRMSPSKFKNQRVRDVAEFIQALSPALVAAASIYLYTIYEHRRNIAT
jgi:hypothetical protein